MGKGRSKDSIIRHINGIIFDLDGTLIDSLQDIAAVVNHIRGARGLAPLPPEAVRRGIGRGVEYLIEKTFQEIPAAQFEDLAREYLRHHHENPHFTGALYPGVRDTLEILRRDPGLKLAIATNKASLVADKTLAHYLPGIAFDFVAGPERVSEKKPDPRHLLDVLDRLRLEPENAWYVGDDPVDAQCAEAAGVRFLGAGYGFGGVRVEETRMLRSFPQLLRKIPCLG